MKYKILVVDDETANLRLLERLFRASYEVVSAESGQDALEQITRHDIALIISDQRMPGMTGIEFLKKAAEIRPQTVRIMLTGYTDAEALVDAINSGVVYKYITKPWINDDLQYTAKRALQHYETLKAQRQLQSQNERLQSRLAQMRDSFVRIIAEMLDLKDPQARRHAERTKDIAIDIGKKMNMDFGELERLALSAFLHEAVDFRIPNHILFKDALPTPVEQQIIEQSFELGLQLLEGVTELEDVVSILRFNHERYDGTGFPMGFAYDQIPLHARIIAVANAYDSMIAPRPPNQAISHEDAIKRLEELAGTKFDPEVVAAFVARPGLSASPSPAEMLEPAFA